MHDQRCKGGDKEKEASGRHDRTLMWVKI